MGLQLLYTLASVSIISLLAFAGILTLSMNKRVLSRLLILFVSFSAGALLGDAFLHLIPESAEKGFTLSTSFGVLVGIIAFFVLEKFVQWRHCHTNNKHHRHSSLAYMNLIGDFFHNLVDGIIIAGSYMTSLSLGFATTLAVFFHEIPQEIGDFGVLLHAGLKRGQALLYNFYAALGAVIGAVMTFVFLSKVENFLSFLIPFTAGGFIYIATADLIPELHKETLIHRSLIQLISFLVGIGVMFALLSLEV